MLGQRPQAAAFFYYLTLLESIFFAGVLAPALIGTLAGGHELRIVMREPDTPRPLHRSRRGFSPPGERTNGIKTRWLDRVGRRSDYDCIAMS